MKKKISKIKYVLMNHSDDCPHCHKYVRQVDNKLFVPCTLGKYWSTELYTNTCPYCGYSFDNSEMIFFPHIEEYLPKCDPIISTLINDCQGLVVNCNDYFAICCADCEELEEDIIALYLKLTYVEKMDPQKTMNALLEWHRGSLSWGCKKPSKELKQIRKLTGYDWYPDNINKSE